MGLTVSKYTGPVKELIIGRKRKFEHDDSEEEMNGVIRDALHTPKRKKLMRTSEYIFRTLFKEGNKSDISVLALGQTYKLHKVYLCQSPYFSSMFSGSWLESTKNYITIEIIDPRITTEALNIVFSSLYLDDLILEPAGIIAVLATATLFQLDGIIEQCVEIMMETINPKTGVQYYLAGCEYGVKKVKEASFQWLQTNLLSYISEHPKRLLDVSASLLTDLISSTNLFVLQTEFSVYLMVRKWLYLKLNPECMDISDSDISLYFSNREDSKSFLHTNEGEKYVGVFRALRLKYLLLHHLDIEVVFTDNIIPKTWLNPEIYNQWYAMLKINQNFDKGPIECSEEVFYKNCLRCGRLLTVEDKQMWRWTGFHFGLDLIVITDGSSMWIKRNQSSENGEMLSQQLKRFILIKVTLVTLNEQRQIKHMQTTGIKSVSFAQNEEVSLLTFDQKLQFPLLVSVNLLLTSPPDPKIT